MPGVVKLINGLWLLVNGYLANSEACCCGCPGCNVTAPGPTSSQTEDYDAISQGTVSGSGTPEDPFYVSDPDCKSGTRTATSTAVLGLLPPPGISWLSGAPQSLGCNAFWVAVTRTVVNYSNEYILGGTAFSASCKKGRTEVAYRLFCLNCETQALEEIDAATVASGTFTVTTTFGTCNADSISGLQCSVAAAPTTGDLPAAPADPTLDCPP